MKAVNVAGTDAVISDDGAKLTSNIRRWWHRFHSFKYY